jgi:hypothetical protein
MNLKAIIYTLLIVIFCYSVTENAKTQGDPAARLKGLKQTLYSLGASIFAPNNQMTKTSGISTLIETGNTNLLANPSFEHATYDTSWTYTGDATKSLETSIVIDGNKSTKVVASIEPWTITQDTTLYESQLAGVQGIVSIWLRTDEAGLSICARQASVTLTGNNCILANPDNTWHEYVVPFVMGAASNGISIDSNSGTGTTYIDNAFVGVMPATMMPEVSQARLVGTLTYPTTTNCIWSMSGTTFANFALDNDCGTATVTGSLIAPATKIPAFVLPAGSQAGTYEIRATSLFYSNPSSDAVCQFRFSDGTNSTANGTAGNTGSAGSYNPYVIGQLTYNNALSSNTTIQIQAREQTGNSTSCDIFATTSENILRFEVYYYPPKSKIYSQQCKSSLDCENVFSWTVAANGAVSGENLDVINGNCTNADPRVCTFNSPIFTVAPNCATDGTEPITAVSSTTVSIDNNAQTTRVVCQKSPPDYKEKNVITGTFANVVTAPNIAKPKTCIYAFGGSGSLSSQTNCTSSPCTEYSDNCGTGSAPTRAATGNYQNMTFADGTWKALSIISCRCTSSIGSLGSNKCDERITSLSTTANGGFVVSPYTTESGASSNPAIDARVVIECTADAP